MSRYLIEEFKEQHKAILSRFETAYTKGVDSDAGKEALKLGKKGLLAHLKKEDEEFYPVMRRAAEKDARLRALLDVFSSDMDQVTGQVLAFFEKYESGSVSGWLLAREFGGLSARLKQRISSEENALYPEYERVMKAVA